MRYLSAFSMSTDPYLAGIEVGEALKDIHPDVVLLFGAINYSPNYKDVFEGLSGGLDDRGVIVFGGTGDGVYETSQSANYAVSALGIHSGGTMSWATSLRTGVRADSLSAAMFCAEDAIAKLGGKPDFCFVMSDGVCADGTAIVEGVAKVITCPIMGGLAGDDHKILQSRVFQGGLEHEDAVAILLGRGPMPFAVNAASGWTPVGSSGSLDSDTTNIRSIGDKRPLDFVMTQTDKPMGQMDIGMISLAAYAEGDSGPFFLRSTRHIDRASGQFEIVGSIKPGTQVRLCSATREDVLRGAGEALKGLTRDNLGFKPEAALIISCAARKWLLEDRVDREIAVTFDTLGIKMPMAGFPSFGEIAPFRLRGGRYTPSFFHNVTFVICLFGS